MRICNSSPAAEERIKAAANMFPKLIPANQSIKKLFGLVSISLLLSGCSAIAAIPLPLRIASNVHTAIMVIQDIDDNPDNDSWIADYIKEPPPQE